MLQLYMDVHVNAAITAGVRRRGIAVLTAQEDGSRRFEDARLLDRATALRRVLFSQDEDFLVIAQERQISGVFFTGLIYAMAINSPLRLGSTCWISNSCVKGLTWRTWRIGLNIFRLI